MALPFHRLCLTGLIGLLIALLSVGCSSLPELDLGDKLAAQGQWDEAVAAYRQAVRKDPFNKALQQRLEQAKGRAAEQHYAEGRRHLADNHIPEALQAFKMALGLDPSKGEHHAAMSDVLRLKEAKDQFQAAEKLRSLGRLEEALTAYERAVELDPNLTQALDGITAITGHQRNAKTLGGSTQPITLRFQNAKLREVFEILARAGGINVLFDKEVRDDPITIFIKDTPFDEALNMILSLNALFAKRVGSDTLLITPNTKQKQDQYQDQMIRTFYLSNAKAKEMVNLIRTMLESKRVYVNEPLNALVIRDTPVKLQLAERIIQANDRREAEVELDVEVLEVNRTKSLKYGLNFAKQAGFGIVPPAFTGGISTGTTGFTYRDLTSLGPNSYLFSLPASVLLDFFKQESDAKTLASPKLRVLNGKQASVNIGEKQPILLSTTNVLPGQAATGAIPTTSTVTSIEFKDTGVKLTVEPTIHLVDEVTLKLKIEVTRLGDLVTLQANPEIKQFRFGTRTAETILNLKGDEAVVLAGLIQDEDRKTRVTVPGLGDIPVLGKLFTSTQDETIATEVVLTITPHIIRNLVPPALDSQAFWSGTETTFATNPLFSPQVVNVAQNVVGQPSGSPIEATPGEVSPGPSGPIPSMSSPPAPATTSIPTGSTSSSTGQSQALAQSRSDAPVAPATSLPATSVASSSMGSSVREQDQVSLVARNVSTLALRPSDLSTVVGQEFRLDLTTDQIENLSESLVTIMFDPQALEFRRVAPVGARISSSAGPGQLSLTLQRAGTSATSGGVLATLIFQARTPGDSPVTIQQGSVSSGSGKTMSIATERTLVHVK